VVEWPRRGWGGVAPAALLAVAAFAGFVVHQRGTGAPLVPRAVLRSSRVAAGALLTGVAGFVLIGTAFVLAVVLDWLGPAATGVRVFPLTAGMVLGAVLCGPVVTRVGPRAACLLSAAASAAALVALAGDPAPSPAWLAVLGGGLGGLLVATTTTAITEVPPALVGVASGLRQSALQLGGALGTAVLGAALAGGGDGGRRALLTAAAVVAAGLLPSLLMKGRDR
ncbi:hypothetical protein AB0A74_33720, partial [Saccharothrix sp. NPDC042600]